MSKIGEHLTTAGYRVSNLDYPSRKEPIDDLTSGVDDAIRKCCLERGGKIHFVTHSLGAIIVRKYLKSSRPGNLGRVVMLSPPNKGSGIVDSMGGIRLFRFIMGPAALQLGTGRSSEPNSLGPADFEVGVITGNRSVNPLGSWLVKGRDDGSVSVESAKLDGMKAFLVVQENHTFIMYDARVIDEIIHFLQRGSFSSVGETAAE